MKKEQSIKCFSAEQIQENMKKITKKKMGRPKIPENERKNSRSVRVSLDAEAKIIKKYESLQGAIDWLIEHDASISDQFERQKGG